MEQFANYFSIRRRHGISKEATTCNFLQVRWKSIFVLHLHDAEPPVYEQRLMVHLLEIGDSYN